MTRQIRLHPGTPPRRWAFLRAASAVLFAGLLQSSSFALGSSTASTFYVDCGSNEASASADGSSPEHAWTSLAVANSRGYRAGDQILFKRGMTCAGSFAPKGSGGSGAPIRVAAYGAGPRPRIDAAFQSDAAFVLFNQQQWEISSLDLTGGTRYGLHISGDHGVLRHIHLSQLTVHDVAVSGSEIKSKASGLIVIEATSADAALEDVVVDGVLAYRTKQWSGIYISGSEGELISAHVTVRNSMVHDMQGDGIVLFRLHEGSIENSAAWRTGMQHTQTLGTPNAIWTWACDGCTVRNNEAFLTDSPGIDGGAFDIDFWNTSNRVIDNYGHDTQGYCVSIFAAYRVTRSSEVSGNLCIRNGLSPRLGAKQGAMFLLTWQRGTLDDVAIKNNVVYWDPAGAYPAIQRGEDLDIHRLTIEGNTIFASAQPFLSRGIPFSGESNRYIYMEKARSDLSVGGEPGGIGEKREIGRGGIACWDGCNYAGKRNPTALETAWIGDLRKSAGDLVHRSAGDWVLYAAIPSDVEAASRQLVLLKSQSSQFRAAGVRVIVACSCDSTQMRQLDDDWQLGADGIQIASTRSQGSVQTVLLISPGGEVMREWHEATSVIDIGLALRQLVGEPIFSTVQ